MYSSFVWSIAGSVGNAGLAFFFFLEDDCCDIPVGVFELSVE
jgi:hypothetical protein